jgi:hypothetical protein
MVMKVGSAHLRYSKKPFFNILGKRHDLSLRHEFVCWEQRVGCMRNSLAGDLKEERKIRGSEKTAQV